MRMVFGITKLSTSMEMSRGRVRQADVSDHPHVNYIVVGCKWVVPRCASQRQSSAAARRGSVDLLERRLATPTVEERLDPAVVLVGSRSGAKGFGQTDQFLSVSSESASVSRPCLVSTPC